MGAVRGITGTASCIVNYVVEFYANPNFSQITGVDWVTKFDIFAPPYVSTYWPLSQRRSNTN